MNKDLLIAAQQLHRVLTERSLTLSAAESCTGGLICACITSIPGASLFFRAGIVSYSTESKKHILGVSPGTILSEGVVSEATARQMAERVRVLTGSDYSLSTTGNLGPGVLEDKDRGLVYVAAGKEGETRCRELRLKGSREENREEASAAALRLLITMLEGESN
ncbi:MAG: CinA family protein [Nitrospiraceae bacterium]|nr:MAG: CinA family protein [Nitrospiraceae bacterium]